MAPEASTTPLVELGRRAIDASRQVARATGAAKDAALLAAAEVLETNVDEVLAANGTDVERALAAGGSPSVVDRLRLTAGRVESMAAGLRSVAALADPVGEVIDGWRRPNGLRIQRVRVPLGVIGVIYENRPNVTSDAAALCLKAGNAVMLRGSSGALASNVAVARCLREGVAKAGLPPDAIALVEDTTRESAVEFMRLRGVIDCLIPRGGHSLIASVLDNATVPYVIDGDGNCHIYVDASADLDQAVAIVANSKTQRPSVCNAAESLLVHEAVAERFLPMARAALEGVELVGDERTRSLLGESIGLATEEDYATEFLDLKLSVAVVGSLDAAIEHIRRFGTGHTEAILTSDLGAAQRFVDEVDTAAVVVNASTRFTDGEQFGFGAEIGISTQKLHARGPMGPRELTTVKYVVTGEGQIRT
jgi:glutamate-5-semialdehyde dehydrogenase